MKRKRFRLKEGHYLVIWSVLMVAAVYLLVRFAALSFSGDVGQAGIKEAILSKVYVKTMESGSSFLRYSAKGKEEAYSFPINFIDQEFALDNFIKDNSLKYAKAEETTSLNDPRTVIETTDSPVNQLIENENSKKVISNIGFEDVTKGHLSREYVLTNGAVYSSSVNDNNTQVNGQLPVGIEKGDVFTEAENVDNAVTTEATAKIATKYTMDQLKDVDFLVRNFYIVAPRTKVTDSLFNAEKLLGEDMKLKQGNDKPQILIYHTHSQEAYVDSREGEESDTVVGVGDYLTKILEEQYGYNVIHDRTHYDVMGGQLDRNLAYNYAYDGIEKILKKNPSIEVVIDLHRDGNDKRSTMINGKETARVMLYNGLCRDHNGKPMKDLENPYLQDNLAFSLQLQMKSLDMYPGLFYKNYLEFLRYNQHVRKKSLLIELGTNKNTLQSAMNAMPPFAEVLNAVLQGK